MPQVVLLADDNKDLREAMRGVLEHHGLTVIEASNGSEAVEIAISQRPDIILTDIAMPVMNGIEATRQIREREELSYVPIIAITAFGDGYRSEAIAAGCDDVLSKPVRLANLLPLLRERLAQGLLLRVQS